MLIYSPDKLIGLHQLPPGIILCTVSSFRIECNVFPLAKAIHTVPIFVSPGTHYCWVDGGCGFIACPKLLNMTSAAGIEAITLDHLNHVSSTSPSPQY